MHNPGKKQNVKTTPDLEIQNKDLYLSAYLKRRGSQYLVSTVSSKSFSSGTFHLLHTCQQLVTASTERAAFTEIKTTIFPLIEKLAQEIFEPKGEYSLSLPFSPQERQSVAKAHLGAMRTSYRDSSQGLVWETARDYRFLMEFEISNPSVLLADLYGIQPKAVQQRVYHARTQGMLRSLGHGRTRQTERN